MSEENKKILISPEICAWADDEHSIYRIEIILPGVEEDNIVLKMHEDSFFIKGENEDTIFVGSYAVCCPIDPEKAKATYKNGLLKVEVPFMEPEFKSIEIKVE